MLPPYVRVSAALKEIATILREEDFESAARKVERLGDHALAIDPEFQTLFLSEITRNKWFWQGMGTIGDICFQDREQNRRLSRAHYELALACEAENCESSYSRDLKENHRR